MIRLKSQPSTGANDRLTYLETIRIKKVAAGEPPPDHVAKGYRDPRVKAAIIAETRGKCAYCESKVTHVYWGDIEHIVPKSRHADRLLDYANLTLACSICNCNKSDYDDPACQLLNPYDDDIDAHLVALGPLVWRRPASDRGEMTILKLDLNRSDLVERRERRLTDVSRLVDRYAVLPDGPLRSALLQQIHQEAAASAEFSFIIRGYLAQIGVGIDSAMGAA